MERSWSNDRLKCSFRPESVELSTHGRRSQLQALVTRGPNEMVPNVPYFKTEARFRFFYTAGSGMAAIGSTIDDIWTVTQVDNNHAGRGFADAVRFELLAPEPWSWSEIRKQSGPAASQQLESMGYVLASMVIPGAEILVLDDHRVAEGRAVFAFGRKFPIQPGRTVVSKDKAWLITEVLDHARLDRHPIAIAEPYSWGS